MNKEIENHIKNKQFGLNNFNSTADKYQTYKPKIVKAFFEDNDFSDFLDLLRGKITDTATTKTYFINLLNEQNKRGVNLVKTYINDLTFEINQNYIKTLKPNSNPNELRSLTIVFYLKCYNRINEEMKRALLDLYDLSEDNYYFE